MKKKDLLVVGELNMDLIFNGIDGFPTIGREIVAGSFSLTLGSSSAIMAANAAALGVATGFAGMVGEDDFGSQVIERLRQMNVGTDFVRRNPAQQTGVSVVMNYAEDRANLTYCGAMNAMTPEDIPWSQLAGFRHFHLSNFFLQKGLRKEIPAIFERARSLGLTTSLDLQWDPNNAWDFDFRATLPFVDVFLPNAAELTALTGQRDVAEAAALILPYGNILALKLGNAGSWGMRAGESVQVKAFQHDSHVDSVGAGDSFNAGFIAAFLEGGSLRDCLTNGNLMGAINTTAAGGTTAFADREHFLRARARLLTGR